MAEIVLLHQAEASGTALNSHQWQPLVYMYIKPIESYCNDIGKDAVPRCCLTEMKAVC